MQTPLTGKDFSILWGRIDWEIPVGNLELTISPDTSLANYDVIKSMQLMRMDSQLGGFNQWLAYAYIIIAFSLVFLGAVLMLVNHNNNTNAKRLSDQ